MKIKSVSVFQLMSSIFLIGASFGYAQEKACVPSSQVVFEETFQTEKEAEKYLDSLRGKAKSEKKKVVDVDLRTEKGPSQKFMQYKKKLVWLGFEERVTYQNPKKNVFCRDKKHVQFPVAWETIPVTTKIESKKYIARAVLEDLPVPDKPEVTSSSTSIPAQSEPKFRTVERERFVAEKRKGEELLGNIEDCIQFEQNGRPAKMKTACMKVRSPEDQKRIREEWHAYQRCIHEGHALAVAEHRTSYSCTLRGKSYTIHAGKILKETVTLKEGE